MNKIKKAVKLFFQNKIDLKESIQLLSISIVLIILCFPGIDFTYNIGIDPSLAWVFNYFFDGHMELGKQLIFPHGPLAFLMYPTYQNALIGIFTKVLLQFIFVYNVFILIRGFGQLKWLLLFTVCFFLLKIYNINLLIISIVLISYLNYFNTNKFIYKFLGIALTAFAFYIKAYVAIITGVITFSFIIFDYYTYRNWIKLLKTVCLGVFLVLLIWIAMYQSFSGFIHYITGMFFLAQDNSAAAAIYSRNNWIYLSVFLIIIVILPFLQKDRKSYAFAILFLLGFFGNWKHGMAREDIYHAPGILFFTLSAMIIFLLYVNKFYFRNIILITIALGFFYLNLENIAGFKPISRELTGITNFSKLVKNYRGVLENSKNKSENNISFRRLPQNIIDSIGKSTVDIYPWDYSFIPANNLKWQPRVVIQSYAAYTSWLDKQNARHFSTNNAPEYLIWHIEGETPTLGGMKSIDGRYLLNDEPQTILEFLKRYQLINFTHNALIYRKRIKELSLESDVLSANDVGWNKWIDVPVLDGELLRAKIIIKGNFKHFLKSFFYKDEAFYIYYKLENGEIVSKKIVPENAEDGIWINPFIQYPADSTPESNVKQILLKCSGPKLMNRTIGLAWESIRFKGETSMKNLINDFFGKSSTIFYSDTTVFKTINSFDTVNRYWNSKPEFYSPDYNYSGQKSYRLNAGEYSTVFALNLDSIPAGEIEILTNAFILSENYDDVQMIISMEKPGNTILWQAKNTYDFLIDRSAWNYIENNTKYYNNPGEKTLLKVYFWNTGRHSIFIDDVQVKIKSCR